MDTINLDHLIVDATDYLCAQAYSTQYHNRILHHWKIMSDWFAAHPSYSNFDDQSLKDFFIDRLGISKLREATIEEQKFTIRASRMLLSYSQDGEFEALNPEYQADHSPDVWNIPFVDKFLNLQVERRRARATIKKKKYSLIKFDAFLKNRNLVFTEDIDKGLIIDFCINVSDNLLQRYNISCCLRQYFKFLFYSNNIKERIDIAVPSFKRIRNKHIPIVLTADEIKSALSKIDRSTDIGKRAYAIFLIILSTGIRVSDIRNLKFENIDWTNDKIKLVQTKTKVPIEFKLLPAVGNAIYDWINNARPESEYKEIFVSVRGKFNGRPLSVATISGIVHYYIDKANIPRLKSLGCPFGGHVLRHSIASGLLKEGVSIFEIKEFLGHKKIESTMVYLTIDEKNLRLCSLEIPEINSIYYKDH